MHRPWELPEWYSMSADMTGTPTGTVVCCVGRSWRRRKRRRHVRRSTSWRLPSTTPYRNDLLTYWATFRGRSNEPGMSVYSLSIQVQSNRLGMSVYSLSIQVQSNRLGMSAYSLSIQVQSNEPGMSVYSLSIQVQSNRLGMSRQAKYWVFIVSRAQSSKFVVCVTLCIINEFVVKSQLETFVVVNTVKKHARQSDYSVNLFIRFISQIISFTQHPTWMALYSLIVLMCRKETTHSQMNQKVYIHDTYTVIGCCCARNCFWFLFRASFCYRFLECVSLASVTGVKKLKLKPG